MSVGGHPPVASRREADRADLWTVRYAGAFELLGEESLQKESEPLFELLAAVYSVKRAAGHEHELIGRSAEALEMIEEEIVNLVGAEGILRLLGYLAAAVGRKQLGADGGCEYLAQNLAQLAASLVRHK